MSANFGHIQISMAELSPPNLRFLTFKSPSLKSRGDVTLFVPDDSETLESLPLVLLLHGVYDSHWAWAMKGGVHLTAKRLIEEKLIAPLVIAMPSDGLFGDGSGYFVHGGIDFENWIVEDVPNCVREILPCIDANSRLLIAGLSMGGFGALRLGAKHASKFSGISAHSALTGAGQLSRFVENPMSDYGDVANEEMSALFWLEKNKNDLPPVRFDCGTDDELVAASRELHEALQALNIPHVHEEFPGGHDWPYWTRHVADTLIFFDNGLQNRSEV